MKPEIQALLVCGSNDRFLRWKSAIDGFSVEAMRARNCIEAGPLLCETPPPHLVMSDTVLADGNWMDVVNSAAKARQKVNVIVVSPAADIPLYLDVMEHGAFDFITDSFTVPEIALVVRSAIEDALQARRSSYRIPAPSTPSPRPRPEDAR